MSSNHAAQQAFQEIVRHSRATVVAPRPRRSTSADAFPRDLVAGRGGARAARRDRSRRNGAAAGATTSATRWRSKRWRAASAVIAVIVVGEQLARRRADRAVRHATRRSRRGCGGSRPASRSARSRCRRSSAGSDAANQQTVARLDERGYVINGRKVWVANAEAADVVIVFAATQPGMRGRGISAFLVPMDTPGIDAASRRTTRSACAGSAAWTSSCATCASAPTRCSARRATASGSSLWALDGGRVAIAAQALGVGRRGARRSAPPRQDRTRRSASRSATTRRSSGCSPTWPPSSTAARMLTLKAADAHDRAAARRRSKRRWPSCSRRRRRIAPPTRRCRSSPRTATAAARWSSGCSGTCAPRRSTRARRKCSGWSSRSRSSG